MADESGNLAIISSEAFGKPKAKAKGKAKAKTKAAAKTAAKAKASATGPNETLVEVQRPAKGQRAKDSELEKLDLQRRLLVIGGKWRCRAEELNEEASIAIGQATCYEACKGLIGIVQLRLERLFALLPRGQNPTFPKESTCPSQWDYFKLPCLPYWVLGCLTFHALVVGEPRYRGRLHGREQGQAFTAFVQQAASAG